MKIQMLQLQQTMELLYDMDKIIIEQLEQEVLTLTIDLANIQDALAGCECELEEVKLGCYQEEKS